MGLVPITLALFAFHFAETAHSLGLFAGLLLRGLLIILAQLHLAEQAFALHFLLEDAQRLIDVVILDIHGYQRSSLLQKYVQNGPKGPKRLNFNLNPVSVAKVLTFRNQKKKQNLSDSPSFSSPPPS